MIQCIFFFVYPFILKTPAGFVCGTVGVGECVLSEHQRQELLTIDKLISKEYRDYRPFGVWAFYENDKL